MGRCESEVFRFQFGFINCIWFRSEVLGESFDRKFQPESFEQVSFCFALGESVERVFLFCFGDSTHKRFVSRVWVCSGRKLRPKVLSELFAVLCKFRAAEGRSSLVSIN